MGRSGKWYIVDCPPQLAFILLNPFQIQEKLEHAIFSASLICLKSNLLLDMIQCQKLSFQSGLVEIISSSLSIHLNCIEILRLFFLQSCFFHNFIQLSHLSFYCTMCYSSACNMLFARVTETHASPQNKCSIPAPLIFIWSCFFSLQIWLPWRIISNSRV